MGDGMIYCLLLYGKPSTLQKYEAYVYLPALFGSTKTNFETPCGAIADPEDNLTGV